MIKHMDMFLIKMKKYRFLLLLFVLGNHFGHTETEARGKLAEQKAMREKKFGIDAF